MTNLPYFADLSATLKQQVSDYDRYDCDQALQHFFAQNIEQLDTPEEFSDIAPVIAGMLACMQQRATDSVKVAFLPAMESSGGEHFPALAIIDENRPFIVESVQMWLEKLGHRTRYTFNALFVVSRDESGALVALQPYEGQEITAEESVESLSLCLLQNYLSDNDAQSLNAALMECFKNICAAQGDWSAMTDQALKLAESIRKNATAEEADFIAWLEDARFTFLGMRQSSYHGSGDDFSIKVDHEESLGILRDCSDEFGGAKAAYQNSDQSLFLFKTASRSPVRRDTPLDAVLIKRYDQAGNCIGDTLFVGLLAWAAYAEPLSKVPLVAQKVQSVMTNFNVEARSYRGRQVVHMLENYSRDLIFQVGNKTLCQHIDIMRRAYRRREFAVLDYFSPFSCSQYLSVIVPRTHYSAALREQMIAYLKEMFGVEGVDYGVHMPDGALWRVDFRVFLDAQSQQPESELLQIIGDHLAELAKNTSDRLRTILGQYYAPQQVAELTQRYGSSFRLDYWNRHNEVAALFDIQTLEAMNQDICVKLYQAPDTWQVRLYNCSEQNIHLSLIMPMLERLGLEVRTEVPYALDVAGREHCSILVFAINNAKLDSDADIDDALLENFSECLEALFLKKSENDDFLALILGAELTWREIVILRAYAKYLQQIRSNHSQRFIAETLVQHPVITTYLVNLFAARFDPENHSSSDELDIQAKITECLEQVENLDQDRLLTRYVQLIQATLRTNFYQENREAIAFKLAPRGIDGIPDPVPLREIFVYSPNFEAVHLRFGFVARGGLRWSDRQEDFRTEILGLVKAQQVKNAVIVPMGSKGGFVLKNAMPDRAAFMTEGVTRYREFIASMLEITDSYLAAGEIRKPVSVVCHDDDDPYLVVAADKGTATFSDFANEMSDQADFWLGDAFASGGSVGYDHKKMGITARGAWESVKRHFREMGHNTQTTPFEAVGVGDMSGDVFGNGMLLSEHIRLIGAFNHLHIVVDPDPDPASSYAERRRLFELPRSGWTDYDTGVLSKGGMIFERSAKSLTLTPEIQAKLQLSENTITPNALIHRLLTMPSDLLWFGGIGTYIKGAQENHLDVGDKANDAIRINGAEVGARVIGEGANLGVTQLGRIDYALAGGRCNTDAIDNSAGVDCSDHEVNIKILIGAAMGNGTLAPEDRVELLESMTDEVGELVLENNYAQTLSLSVTEAAAPRLLDMHQRVMHNFERLGELNRVLEGLPDDEEIERRRLAGHGLTRPELSVLLAYGKNIVYGELQKSAMLDDAFLHGYLVDYFPKALQKKFPNEIANHQLRREIIATVITNTVINRSGVGFIIEMSALTGATADRICMAYLAVCAIFDLPEIWQETESLDNIASSALQHKILTETTFTISRMTEWLLRNVAQPIEIEKTIALYGAGLQELKSVIMDVLSPEAQSLVEERAARFKDDTVSEALSKRVGQLKILSSVCDIVDLANKSNRSIKDTAHCYFAVSDRFALDRLRTMANTIQANDVWTAQALSASIDDLWGLQSEIALQALSTESTGDGLAAWEADKQDKLLGLDVQFSELFQRRQIDVAVLSVIQRQIRMLL